MPLAESLTLALAVDQLDLVAMRDRLGPGFKVGDLRPLLRCSKCGGKQIIVTTLWKSSTITERMMQHWK